MGSGFRDIGQFSKLPYLGMKLGHPPKCQMCTYTYFLPKGSKLRLFSLYWQRFPRYRPIFNIAIFGHETWALVKMPDVAHIPFLPQGGEIKLIFALRAAVFEIQADFQNCPIFEWNLATGQNARCCTYTLFLPRGSKLSLFLFYGLRFSRYGLILKIAIFGHETWPLAKMADVAHICSFYPRGVEIKLIFTLRTAVFEIWVDFQNCHIWAWNLAIGQSFRNCIYTSWNTPRVPNFTPFCFTTGHFQDTSRRTRASHGISRQANLWDRNGWKMVS